MFSPTLQEERRLVLFPFRKHLSHHLKISSSNGIIPEHTCFTSQSSMELPYPTRGTWTSHSLLTFIPMLRSPGCACYCSATHSSVWGISVSSWQGISQLYHSASFGTPANALRDAGSSANHWVIPPDTLSPALYTEGFLMALVLLRQKKTISKVIEINFSNKAAWHTVKVQVTSVCLAQLTSLPLCSRARAVSCGEVYSCFSLLSCAQRQWSGPPCAWPAL